jgi:hypothetical protein
MTTVNLPKRADDSASTPRPTNDADKEYQQEVLTQLSQISDLLIVVVNHLRQISGIEQDKGEEF